MTEGVYAPQKDSQLLVDVMEKTGLAHGRRVADLCTGSGVVATAARELGAVEVTAFDICSRAVHCARTNAATAGVDVAVHLGSWARGMEFGPFDLIVCNPPYVPHDPSIEGVQLPPHIGPPRAWDAGSDGRLVLDPLCATANELLADGGTMLLVQSESRDHVRRLRGWPALGWALRSLPGNGFPSAPCCRRVRSGLKRPVGSSQAVVTKSCWSSGRTSHDDSEPRIVRMVPSGPVMVQGPVRIEMSDGSAVESDRFMVAICTCRRSKSYPPCDTSHRCRQRPERSGKRPA